jgi:endonuclease IV
MLYRLIPQAEFKPFRKFFQNSRNCTIREAEQSNRTLSHPKKSQLMIHRLYINDVNQPDAIDRNSSRNRLTRSGSPNASMTS